MASTTQEKSSVLDLESGNPSDVEKATLSDASGKAAERSHRDINATQSEPLERPISRRSLSRHSIRSDKKHVHIAPEIYPETDLEKGVVGWDGQDDPMHPRNYRDSRKWMILGFVSGITFLSPLTSTMPAPGVSFMNAEFHNTSSLLSTLTVSIFVLGFVVGPLVLSPLSEIYGRRPVLAYSNIFLTVWQLGCALAPNQGSLIAFRFFGGVGGSACLTIGGGVIADLFPTEQRGLANAMYVMGPLFGPVIGPIIGGFVAQRAGWRWTYWVLLIACGILTLGYYLVSEETNAFVLIRAKTEKLKKETGREDLISAYDVGKDAAALKTRAVLTTGITRPFRMLLTSPMLSLLALYLAFVFGLNYLVFTTVTPLFIDAYNWSPELCGLAYLGIGVGFAIGMATVAKTSDSTVIRLTKANKGVFEPEMRLASTLVYAPFIPITFFWYGWSAAKQVHWIVPILGLIPLGFGTIGIFSSVQTYFIDATGQYAASAVGGLTASRCLGAAFLPLAGPKMYASMGLGWGNSLLGFVALGLIPAPALIYRYGGIIRKKYPIQLE